VDPKLDFKSHIENLEIKIAKSVGILSKLRFFLPKLTLLLLYHAFIHPHLIFFLPVWGITFPIYLSKLQLFQNKAIRIIANCNRFQSVTPYFHELEILKISELFQFKIGKIMHKHFNKNLPIRFNFMFTPLSSISTRHVRSKTHCNYYLPKYSTSRCQRSIHFQGVKIWNSLSSHEKHQSFAKFKSSFKKQLEWMNEFIIKSLK